MTYEEFKQTPIVDYLASKGYKPASVRGNRLMYLSPLRSERTPSFSVDVAKNLWYDFGLGDGGNIVKLALLFYDTDFRGLLDILHPTKKIPKTLDQRMQEFLQKPRSEDSLFEVVKVVELKHPSLIQYLTDRHIQPTIARRYCQEIYYTCTGRFHFGIGFPNRKGGYEIRTSLFKGSTSPKDISVIQRREGNGSVALFEGFMDFLSAEQMGWISGSDVIVLNSVCNLKKALPLLERYGTVGAFFDNDKAGRKCTLDLRYALRPGQAFADFSSRYAPHNDVNEYLQHQP